MIDQRLFEMANYLMASAFRVTSSCGDTDVQFCSLDLLYGFRIFRENARRALLFRRYRRREQLNDALATMLVHKSAQTRCSIYCYSPGISVSNVAIRRHSHDIKKTHQLSSALFHTIGIIKWTDRLSEDER